MKDAARKQRLRELLQAEGLAGDREKQPNKVWDDLKKQLNAEFLSARPPRLEIQAQRKRFWQLWQLLPAFALVGLGVFLLFRQHAGVPAKKDVVAEARTPVRAFKQGDLFISGKREIRFLSGAATLTEANNQIRIQAQALKADFRLRQKVDMQIEHPLVTVTITGTEFTFDASARRGVIHLTEGRLRIDLKSVPAAEPVILVAPVRFDFSEKSHQVKKAEPQKSRPLYRYELHSGEVFYAHPVTRDARMHRVELLGGKTEQIAVEDILRFVPVEDP